MQKNPDFTFLWGTPKKGIIAGKLYKPAKIVLTTICPGPYKKRTKIVENTNCGYVESGFYSTMLRTLSSRMQCCVTECAVPSVSKDNGSFIFKGQDCLNFKIKAPQSLKCLEPLTQWHGITSLKT